MKEPVKFEIYGCPEHGLRPEPWLGYLYCPIVLNLEAECGCLRVTRGGRKDIGLYDAWNAAVLAALAQEAPAAGPPAAAEHVLENHTVRISRLEAEVARINIWMDDAPEGAMGRRE